MAIGTQAKFKQQPGEVKTYGIDFADFFTVGERTDKPSSASVSAEPGITVELVALQETVVWIRLSGGTDGTTYRGTVTLETTSGDIEQADFSVRVKD